MHRHSSYLAVDFTNMLWDSKLPRFFHHLGIFKTFERIYQEELSTLYDFLTTSHRLRRWTLYSNPSWFTTYTYESTSYRGNRRGAPLNATGGAQIRRLDRADMRGKKSGWTNENGPSVSTISGRNRSAYMTNNLISMAEEWKKTETGITRYISSAIDQ